MKEKSRLSVYFRWILGAVLMAAGILKIADPENMVEVLMFFELTGEEGAYLAVYGISVLEIVLAVMLFRNYLPRATAVVVSAMCGVFVLIAVVGYLDNWSHVCGCLGRFSFGKFDMLMVIRNFVLLSMSLWLVRDLNIVKRDPQRGKSEPSIKTEISHD